MPINEISYVFPAAGVSVPFPTAGSPQNLAASGSIAEITDYIQGQLLQGRLLTYDPFGGIGNGTTGSAAQQSLMGVMLTGSFLDTTHYLNISGSNARAAVSGSAINLGFDPNVTVTITGSTPSGATSTDRINFSRDFALVYSSSAGRYEVGMSQCFISGSASGSVTLPYLGHRSVVCYSMTGNSTFTLPGSAQGVQQGDELTVILVQDGTGGRTSAFVPGTDSGVTITTSDTGNTAGKRKTITFVQAERWVAVPRDVTYAWS